MRCLTLLAAVLPAVSSISIPVTNSAANNVVEAREIDSALFARENGLCCGTNGFDTNTKAYFYKADKTLATRTLCGARCLSDSKCVSFAFGNGICLGYDVAAEGNVQPYGFSPFKFFERKCQTGADPSFTPSIAPGLNPTSIILGALPAASAILDVAAQTCGKYGYDRHSPLAFAASTEHCTLAKCSAYCQSKTTCKSFAVGKGQCLLYDAPISPANFNRVPTSPYKFYDKSCDTAESSSSTPTYTPTPMPSSASPSGAASTHISSLSTPCANSTTKLPLGSSIISAQPALSTAITIASSGLPHYTNSSSTLYHASSAASAVSSIILNTSPSASPTSASPTSASPTLAASESASGTTNSSTPSQTPTAPNCEGKELFYVRADSPPTATAAPKFWGYIQNGFQSTGLRGVYDGKINALIVCHNVAAGILVADGQELLSTNTATYPDLDRVGFVVGGPSTSDFSPDQLGFAYMTSTRNLPRGPAVDGDSAYNRAAQATKQVAASLWRIEQATGLLTPQWINQNGMPASSELILFGTSYSFYSQPIVTLASSKSAYDYEYGRFGTSSAVLRLERVVK